MNCRINVYGQLGHAYLHGRTLGRSHYSILCGLLSEVAENETVILDFEKVEMVTASWLNEALAPLIEWAEKSRNELFPVLINFKSAWLDELSVVSQLTYKCFLVSQGEGEDVSAVVIGKLDVGQRETLDAVVAMQDVTGAMLERSGVNPSVKATAWNNRLRDLYQKRLLKRRKSGREQVYSPVLRKVRIYG